MNIICRASAESRYILSALSTLRLDPTPNNRGKPRLVIDLNHPRVLPSRAYANLEARYQRDTIQNSFGPKHLLNYNSFSRKWIEMQREVDNHTTSCCTKHIPLWSHSLTSMHLGQPIWKIDFPSLYQKVEHQSNQRNRRPGL